MSNFLADLEQRCRKIAESKTQLSNTISPTLHSVREIAIVLSHLDQLRESQQQVDALLLKQELELDTQILNLKSRPSLNGNWREQNHLRNQYKQRIEYARWHHQGLSKDRESAIRQLQLQLLQLLNKYNQLHDGDSQTAA